jgi:geranylgeranyl pyrophosphate synthase
VLTARGPEIRRARIRAGRRGHRLRARRPRQAPPAGLTLAVYAKRGQGDATELAAAVEVIHTYSLVHDDLVHGR